MRIVLLLIILELVRSSFDSQGRLQQLELAHKASEQGGATIVVRGANDIVVLNSKNPSERTATQYQTCNIHTISRNCFVTFSGVVSDTVHLTEKLVSDARDHESLFGTSPTINRLTTDLANYMHEKTLYSGTRPFGAKLCLFGVDKASEKMKVFEIDPTGSYRECSISCLGNE